MICTASPSPKKFSSGPKAGCICGPACSMERCGRWQTRVWWRKRAFRPGSRQAGDARRSTASPHWVSVGPPSRLNGWPLWSKRPAPKDSSNGQGRREDAMRALYRIVLLICPAAVRRTYAEELEEAFLHCLEVERRRRPRHWQPLFVLYGLFDALLFSLSARRDAIAGRLPVSPIPVPSRRSLMKKQDVRLALRLMRKQPTLAAGIVLMLGLGIGATTALFSVVQGVLLKPLPFPEPDQIVQVWGTV